MCGVMTTLGIVQNGWSGGIRPDSQNLYFVSNKGTTPIFYAFVEVQSASVGTKVTLTIIVNKDGSCDCL